MVWVVPSFPGPKGPMVLVNIPPQILQRMVSLLKHLPSAGKTMRPLPRVPLSMTLFMHFLQSFFVLGWQGGRWPSRPTRQVPWRRRWWWICLHYIHSSNLELLYCYLFFILALVIISDSQALIQSHWSSRLSMPSQAAMEVQVLLPLGNHQVDFTIPSPMSTKPQTSFRCKSRSQMWIRV